MNNDNFYIIDDMPPKAMSGPYTYDQVVTISSSSYRRDTPQEFRYHAGPTIQVRFEHLQSQINFSKYAGFIGGVFVGLIAATIIAVMYR